VAQIQRKSWILALIALTASLSACGATRSNPSDGASSSNFTRPTGTAVPSPTPVLTFSMSRSLPNAPTSTPTELVERADMEAVIKLAKTRKLERAEGTDLFKLPAEFSHLSLDGQITVNRDTDDLTVIFYVVLPGGPDHYSGWVYRDSGKLTSDPNAGGPATVNRIDDHWFWVVAF
jgi:hypothetical protein